MNWPVADENGPMLCRIEIPQYSNYGGGGMGTSFRRNDFWDRLAGHLWLVLLMAALKIIYQAKLTLAAQKIPFSLRPKPAYT